MGSGSSRLEGCRQSRARVNRSSRSCFFSSLICGGSSSRATLKMENYSDEIAVNTDLINSDTLYPAGLATGSTSSITETGAACGSSATASEGTSAEDGLGDMETSNLAKHLSSRKDLVTSYQVRDDFSHEVFSRHRNSVEASTSFREQESSGPVSVILSANRDAVDVLENSEKKGVSEIQPSSSCPQGVGDSHADGVSIDTYMDEGTGMFSSNSAPFSSNSAPFSSDVPVNFQSLRDESFQEDMGSGLGFLVDGNREGQGDGGVLHVDVVSISSSILSDTSSREVRRNSRRLFWNAFSRRSSRRHLDSPAIFFSTDDTEDLLSHERWLLDFSGDVFDDGIGHSGYLGRIHSLAQRRQSRSEFWERLSGSLDEHGQRSIFCPSGLHRDGRCSCESSPTTQETSTRESISRIVMLAEALFEVLDEIHQQPLSLPLSMISLPAPEYIVDSFPLKNHKTVNKADDNVEQCYICLAEYEEGDKIRILPCNHEYHMSCVDKWLKEIHGVCPLCRGDVRQGADGSSSESYAPNPEIRSS